MAQKFSSLDHVYILHLALFPPCPCAQLLFPQDPEADYKSGQTTKTKSPPSQPCWLVTTPSLSHVSNIHHSKLGSIDTLGTGNKGYYLPANQHVPMPVCLSSCSINNPQDHNRSFSLTASDPQNICHIICILPI